MHAAQRKLEAGAALVRRPCFGCAQRSSPRRVQAKFGEKVTISGPGLSCSLCPSRRPPRHALLQEKAFKCTIDDKSVAAFVDPASLQMSVSAGAHSFTVLLAEISRRNIFWG